MRMKISRRMKKKLSENLTIWWPTRDVEIEIRVRVEFHLDVGWREGDDNEGRYVIEAQGEAAGAACSRI